jgi:hypothetical protein
VGGEVEGVKKKKGGWNEREGEKRRVGEDDDKKGWGLEEGGMRGTASARTGGN